MGLNNIMSVNLYKLVAQFISLYVNAASRNSIYTLEFKIIGNVDLIENQINVDLRMKNKISNKEILSANYNYQG